MWGDLIGLEFVAFIYPYSTRIRVVISIFRTSILFNFVFWHIAFRSVHLDRFGPFDVFSVVFVTYRY